jgi:flagellar assembly factor FliW
MKIESPVFGTVELAEDKIIEFPEGLPGFEACKRFALVHEEGSSLVLLLHSVDDPAVVLSLTTPETFGVHYEFTLSDDEVAALQLAKPEDALVTVIVWKDEGGAGAAAGGSMRAHFMAPVVINVATRRGLQKVINKLGCDVTLRAEG